MPKVSHTQLELKRAALLRAASAEQVETPAELPYVKATQAELDNAKNTDRTSAMLILGSVAASVVLGGSFYVAQPQETKDAIHSGFESVPGILREVGEGLRELPGKAWNAWEGYQDTASATGMAATSLPNLLTGEAPIHG